MSHLIKVYTVCPLVFELSLWCSLDETIFEFCRRKILSFWRLLFGAYKDLNYNFPERSTSKMKRYQDKIIVCVVLMMLANYCAPSSKQNVTVVYMTERSNIVDLSGMINRTIGLVQMAVEKSKEIVKHTANLDILVKFADVPGCIPLQWGALAAEMYHINKIDAILGPGKQLLFHIRSNVNTIVCAFIHSERSHVWSKPNLPIAHAQTTDA